MLITLKILFISLLFIIVYQDFKERKVTAYLFFTLIILGGYLHYTTQYSYTFILNLLFNISVLFFLTIIIFSYTKYVLKKKFQEAIGFGDILFFIVLSISFPTATFLVLLNTSLIFSLILFLALKSRLQIKTVPLAGLQALFLAIILIINLKFEFVNLYSI